MLLALALLGAPCAKAQEVAQPYQRVRIDLRGQPGGIGAIGALGIPVDHVLHRPGHWMEAEVGAWDLRQLDDAGIPYTVLIADAEAHYRSLNTGAQVRGSSRTDGCQTWPYADPANFALGSMGGYFTWEEMIGHLDAMRAAFPQLVSEKLVIGESHEGRPVYHLRISNNADSELDRPEVLYTALHHAREPGSLSQLIWFMWYLLEHYGTDPEVTYLLDHLELHFVPCINPDGYVYNQTQSPEGGGLWRKNRRPNPNGSFGVDLNRNYGYFWGVDNQGSSGNQNSDVYRGPAPFSEPETQAIRALCEAHEFRLAQNYHTFGNLLVHPWGYALSTYTPDSAAFAEYAHLLCDHHHYKHGTADQTVNYPVNGGSDDWMYGEQDSKPKTFSMTPEVGGPKDWFWPPAERIVPLCRENIPCNLLTAHLAGTFATTTDAGPPFIGGSAPHAAFTLHRLGLEPGTFTVAVEPLEGVLSAGAPRVFAGMAELERRTDSIPLVLDPALDAGDAFRYVLATSNGLYTWRDTVTKVIGDATTLIFLSGTTMSGWQPGAWGTTSTAFYSAPSSITDSPFGDYAPSSANAMTRVVPLDLSNTLAARLRFRTRWDIEPRYDRVQVLASANGTAWTALCGRHTRPGSLFQGLDEPMYDGFVRPWVPEEMVLDDFLGGPLFLRFELVSDEQVERDGFYVDDLELLAVLDPTSGMADPGNGSGPRLFPNPASGSCQLAWPGWHAGLAAGAAGCQVQVVDPLGRVVRTQAWPSPAAALLLEVDPLAAGAYTVVVNAAGRTLARLRLVVEGR